MTVQRTRRVWLLFTALLIAACASKQLGVVDTLAPTTAQMKALNVKLRSDWRKILQWEKACESSFQVSYSGQQSGIEEYSLGGEKVLVSVLCSAGAYQPSFVYFLVDKLDDSIKAKQIKFTTYESMDGQTLQASVQTELWGEPMFNPDRGELNILNFARQTGDCGSWTVYDLNGENAELLEVWTRFPCPAKIEARAEQKIGVPPEGWVRVDHKQPLD